MSAPIRPARPIRPGRSRAGYTLIEVLVVLAIFALSTAIIMPSTARMLDQTTAHAVFFEFQRQMSDLRREANRTGEPVRVVDPQCRKQRAIGFSNYVRRGGTLSRPRWTSRKAVDARPSAPT